MSDYLRRMVVLGPEGVITPWSPQDYRNNRRFFLETGTPWVRLWADWPTLQPEPTPPDLGPGAGSLNALDEQIQAANADGVRVFLTSNRHPLWANGMATFNEEADAVWLIWDRVRWNGDVFKRKSKYYGMPLDLSLAGPYGQWLQFLANRYSRNNPLRKGVVDVLNFVNEPNHQLWPQMGDSDPALDENGPDEDPNPPWTPGPVTIHKRVADMFETAHKVGELNGWEPMMAGPSTADPTERGKGDRLFTPFEEFTELLLDELNARNFPGHPRLVWTHHNFTDVEYDRGPGSISGREVNGTAAVRQILTERGWKGWPSGDPADAGVWVGEGGARLQILPRVYKPLEPTRYRDPAFIRLKQAEHTQRDWDRMLRSPGVGMVCANFFYSVAIFDSGLLDPDGTRRPAFTTWKSLPVFR
ncbi:MAG TPA: hypothetical protein VHF89_13345 [Solirubrobacteraceae bacterium]|nr:hypothetical protein [Solirubrobacteraceae bacterium]